MFTRYIKVKNIDENLKDINYAAEKLQKGHLVAFPTETVYGLGADAFNPEAIKKIFKAKGRPQDNPLIVHIADIDLLKELAKEVPPKAQKLIDNFWPGPLTVILKKTEKVIDEVTAGLDTVGIRMPDNLVALTLLEKANVPVAAPSANISGKPSPTSGLHVLRDLAGKVDVVIDAGRAKVGVESTVVDLTGEKPIILRPGGITKEQLEEIVGEVEIDPALKEDNLTPKSPGMKYTHYAPDGDMYVYVGENIDLVAEKMSAVALKKHNAGHNVAIIAFEDTLLNIKEKPFKIFSLGKRENPKIAATKIYSILRQCDRMEIDFIIAEGCSTKGIGLALMNRLSKAAGGKIIKI